MSRACALRDVELEGELVVLAWVITCCVFGSVYKGVLRGADPTLASILLPPAVFTGLAFFCDNVLRCTALAIVLQATLFYT